MRVRPASGTHGNEQNLPGGTGPLGIWPRRRAWDRHSISAPTIRSTIASAGSLSTLERAGFIPVVRRGGPSRTQARPLELDERFARPCSANPSGSFGRQLHPRGVDRWVTAGWSAASASRIPRRQPGGIRLAVDSTTSKPLLASLSAAILVGLRTRRGTVTALRPYGAGKELKSATQHAGECVEETAKTGEAWNAGASAKTHFRRDGDRDAGHRRAIRTRSSQSEW